MLIKFVVTNEITITHLNLFAYNDMSFNVVLKPLMNEYEIYDEVLWQIQNTMNYAIMEFHTDNFEYESFLESLINFPINQIIAMFNGDEDNEVNRNMYTWLFKLLKYLNSHDYQSQSGYNELQAYIQSTTKPIGFIYNG